MDRYRRMLEQIKSTAGVKSFRLVDGTEYRLPDEGVVATEMFTFSFDCMRADWHRQMRPAPHRFYKALCQAADRREAVRLFLPEWTEHDPQNAMSPYSLRKLISDGVLEDMPFAPSGMLDGEWKDTTPIPYAPSGDPARV